MQFVNSLLLVISIKFIVTHCQENCDDDPPCTNDDLYGTGNMCYFAFLEEISQEEMHKNWSADAKLFLKGCLHDFTLDFVDDCRCPGQVVITIVPENGKVVWGYTYLIPVDSYQSQILPKMLVNSKDKVFRSQKIEVEVTIDGRKQNINCNAMVAVNQPKKESCIPLERQVSPDWIDTMIRTFTAAHFPPEYIEEIRNIPQRFCKECK